MKLAQSSPPTKRSLYEELRHQIISMQIEPGADLDEKTLVETFGVSRTPVREALIRLSADGLVEIRKNRGATVTALDLKTLQSIFEAGDLIEKAYTRLACLRRTDKDLEEILIIIEQFESDMAKGDVTAMVESNSHLHQRVAAAGYNKYFSECYRRILADHERIAQIWYSDNMNNDDQHANKTILRQHRELYQALLDRDAEKAESISMSHASLCKEGVRNTLIAGESIISDLVVEEMSD